MKKLVILSIFSFIFLGNAAVAGADTSCQPIYGGGQTCVTTSKNLTINKTVQNPKNSSFVDNLGINDPRYQPEQVVNFQITVTNTGNTTLGTVTVRDVFPQFVTFVSGAGSFDSASKTLSFDVTNLNPGEQRTFTVQAKVVGAGSLPQNQAITCVVNQANATSNGMNVSDNSQFCIEKKAPEITTKGGIPVMPAPKITTTPPTGPEMLPLIGLLPMGALGAFLRRKTS